MYDYGMSDIFTQIQAQSDLLAARDAARFDVQRGYVQQDSFSGIFDQIGSVFGKIKGAMDARDYAESVAAAKAQARANALAVSKAQQESNLKMAEFQAELYNQNANYLKGTALNQMKATVDARMLGEVQKNKFVGQAKSGMAASNVDLSSGSATDVVREVKRVSDQQIQSNYFAGLNSVNKTLADVAAQKTNALYVVYEAKERNRFLDANAQMSVY